MCMWVKVVLNSEHFVLKSTSFSHNAKSEVAYVYQSHSIQCCIDKYCQKRFIEEATSCPVCSLGISFVEPHNAKRLAVSCLIVLLEI